MRFLGVVSVVVLFCCLPSADVYAASAKGSTIKPKLRTAPTPARPTGTARIADPQDAYYGGSKLDTITESRNELGQTVYSVAASHFDVSPPLRDMAAASVVQEEAEQEPPTNPQLPPSRIVRSDQPDPVVQAVVRPVDALRAENAPLAAPVTGFNFLGVGINGGSPSDSNGSVGGNQFVETVNTRYQVWTLNRATQTATIALAQTSINSLWSGFGGACSVQNSGDPIVLYDKTAKRWLISQFTSTASNGVYYQCVALSTSADATGTYARYAFAVPNGKFGDYPHFGVWPPAAYFMMAHGFGGTFAAIFAALDRSKMLVANATATWLVILDPNEGGHMPADLDGYAIPPSLAPGVFVSLHDDGMYIYRMKVSFSGAGSASKTLQAIVPTAAASAACGGGTCIPQPGVPNLLDALSDRLMFRAAYRNYIDHESLVVSHSVDPGVSGLVSGVRWYDIRLSGNPDATCPTYPCMYQQGTIADVANGRSRWMPSIAMDSAENILVGYSATGTSNGTDNHSLRYTGRAKADPPGLMTAPESTIATGTANNVGNSRWGDYSSMSIDPSDDCTFWYVGQYYATQNAWSTQVASIAFPQGTSSGQCAPTACNNRPTAMPGMGGATAPLDNQIVVTWTAANPVPASYVIERAEGVCGNEGLYRPLAAVPNSSLSYTDTGVQGGVTYSYRVRTAGDAAGRCQAQLANACVSATATGACNLAPTFSGATGVADAQQSNCGLTVSWGPGASRCPANPELRYDVFRGTVPDFVPSAGNRIASCVAGPSSYLDTDNLSSGTTYYYVVRAEGTNNGVCSGTAESNVATVRGIASAPGMQVSPGIFADGGGDNTATLLLNVAGPGDTADQAWRIVKTASDPGANHTPGGAYAYRNAGPSEFSSYGASSCAEVQTTSLTAAGSTVNLGYWERHQLEYHWDGVAVEYAVNGGVWTDAPAPSNNPADGCDPADVTSDWEPLTCSNGQSACGFTSTKSVITGPLGSGSSCSDFATSTTVTSYGHRCHRIAGLNPNDTIQFRWRFSSDSGAQFAGLYLDDVQVSNVRLPNTCTPNTCTGQPDGTFCDDGNPCSANDTCSGNVCAAGTPFTSAETLNLRVQADKTSYVWDALQGATRYDVVRGTLGAFPVGPGGGDESCFDDLATPVLPDSTIPPPSSGFWYLSRAENTCGSGSFGQQSDGSQRTTTTCP